jgi:translation initiation factor 1A
MPGGKKHRRTKKHAEPEERRLQFAEKDQFYAQVKKLLGDRRMEVVDAKGTSFSARVRGKFRKRVWINKGDWVLVYRPGFGDTGQQGCVIVHVYKPAEVRKLVKSGEITTPTQDFQEEEFNEEDEFAEFQQNDSPTLKQRNLGGYMDDIDLPPSRSSEYESSEEEWQGEESSIDASTDSNLPPLDK